MARSLLLLILLAAADGFRISSLSEKQSNNILAVQWPPYACLVNGWSSSACKYEYWTIHGWWPPKAVTKNGDKFHMKKIKDLKNDLKKFWPDLIDENDKGFWKREWDKHGNPGNLRVHEYFKKALDLFNKVLGNCTEPDEEIKNCLRKKGKVKEYILVWDNTEGEVKTHRCTVHSNRCRSHQSNNEKEFYVVEARLVLPDNFI